MDACGRLYVTEYIRGTVWRFTGERAAAEVVASLSSTWIPNLHWGLGLGGWESETVYVSACDGSGVLEPAGTSSPQGAGIRGTLRPPTAPPAPRR